MADDQVLDDQADKAPRRWLLRPTAMREYERVLMWAGLLFCLGMRPHDVGELLPLLVPFWFAR
jgi:hypothetical protein